MVRPPFHHRHTCGETMRDKKGRQHVGKADAPSNTGTLVGRLWETMGEKGREGERRGDKILGRRTHHPTQAHMWGDNERQWGALGDKTCGRRTHHPTPAHMWGDYGKRWETREGQETEKANTSSNTGTCEKRGDKTLGKADTPSNKGKQEGVQWEARPPARQTHHPTRGNIKGHTGIQGETRPSERRTHHPTKGNKKGYSGRQRETRPSERRTHHPTKGNKGETRPSETWTHHPTKGNKKGHNGDKGRQDRTHYCGTPPLKPRF